MSNLGGSGSGFWCLRVLGSGFRSCWSGSSLEADRVGDAECHRQSPCFVRYT